MTCKTTRYQRPHHVASSDWWATREPGTWWKFQGRTSGLWYVVKVLGRSVPPGVPRFALYRINLHDSRMLMWYAARRQSPSIAIRDNLVYAVAPDEFDTPDR